MLSRHRRRLPGATSCVIGRHGNAALEFALLTPMVTTLLLAVFDTARALIVWQEAYNAAEAIAQGAEKLSVTAGSGLSSLTATQAQAAMTAIYAQIPGLNRGGGTGIYTGPFAVTLSSVVYVPTCTVTAGCGPQAPYTLWSSFLTEGGPQLVTNSSPSMPPLLRGCGKLTAVAQFPNDASQLTKMLDPTKVAGGGAMILTPQIVADVRYQFTPMFSLFLKPITFWASATVPAPLGISQAITFNAAAPTGNVVSCTVPA